MARDKSEIVEVDLRGGVITNESGYAIGSRLLEARNVAWNPPYPATAFPSSSHIPAMLSMLQNFKTAVLGPVFNDAYEIDNILFGNRVDGEVLLQGANLSTTNLALWHADGTQFAFAGGVPLTSILGSGRPGSGDYWETPGAGANITGAAVFFSHPLADQVYYLLDSAGDIRSMTVDVTNCPAGADAIVTYLDRLWLVKSATPTSRIFFTDPLDAETIRSTSFIAIPDFVTCLQPQALGNIDASGVPHLLIGCASSLWVLDGDPTSGTAILRQLATGVRIRSTAAMTTTPFGAMFVSHTDGQVYLVPPGAQMIRPIGTPIRDQCRPDLCIAWLHPFLLIAPQGPDVDRIFTLDFTDPDRPKWWGPSRAASTSNKPDPSWIMRAPRISSTVISPQSIYAADVFTNVAGRNRVVSYSPQTLDYQALRTPGITTGFFHRPGYDVSLVRVILCTTTKTASYTWTVKGWTPARVPNQGTVASVTGVLQGTVPSGISGQDITDVVRHVYTFPTAVRGDYFYITVDGQEGTEFDLQRVLVEVRTEPRQD